MNQLPTSEHPSPPAIWNPNAAANWSLLFTPAFGAFIHARNAESLGRSDEAKANRKWFYGNLVFLGIILLSTLTPSLGDAPFRMVSLVILLVWYFALAKKQAKYVKDTFGSNYQKKTWGKPLLIAFACFVGFMLLAIALAFVAELINGTKVA
jgi:hypothetical protein